ncbi:MAG: hypothetical protein Q4D06_07530 [Coriobacteriia bacterium]|nr:hypothetical protein [Coriobacteriia bacterium]
MGPGESLLILTLSSVPFVALWFSLLKVNVAPEHRCVQVVMPVAAAVYSLLAALLCVKATVSLGDVWFFACSEVPGLTSYSGTYAVSVAFNTIALLLFLGIKVIVTRRLDADYEKYSTSLRSAFGFAYEQVEVDGEKKWSLTRQYVKVGKLYKTVMVTVLVISLLLFFASLAMPQVFPSVFCPIFALLILGEIYCFLDGAVIQPGEDALTLEDEDSTRISQYQGLMRVYEKFKNRILYSGVTPGTSGAPIYRNDIIGPLSESADHTDQLSAIYLKSLQDIGMDLDADMAQAMIRIARERSVIFATPFYEDCSSVIFYPLARALSKGEKVLILTGTDVPEDSALAWVDESLQAIAGASGIWRTGKVSEGIDGLDVTCMPLSSLNRWDVFDAAGPFLEKVRYVILMNPSTIMATSQIGLSVLARCLSRNGSSPAYIVTDRNTNGLVDALSHLLGTSFVEVSPTSAAPSNSCSVVWRAEDPESTSLHHRIFGGIAQYLGTGMELASIALKYDVDHVEWRGIRNVPMADVRWISLQYYPSITRYAGLPSAAASVDSRMTFSNGIWQGQKTDNGFFVVEDEDFNAYEVLRQFSARAKKCSFVNVISPDYLLRDYMGDNATVLLNDAKAIPRIVPDCVVSPRNVALTLFAQLSVGDISEEAVKEQLVAADVDGMTPEKGLTLLAHRFIAPDIPLEDLQGSILRVEVDRGVDTEQMRFASEMVYRFAEGCELSRRCSDLLEHVFYVDEDDIRNRKFLDSCLADQLYQRVLPGQFTVMDGKYYEVLGTRCLDGQNVLVVRRAADHFTKRRQYRQVRRVQIQEWAPSSSFYRSRTIDGIELEIGECSFTVETDGYLDMDSLGNFATAKFVELKDIPVRSYSSKKAIRLKFQDADPQIVATITVLLSELFKSVYSKDSDFLEVASAYADQSDFPEGVVAGLEGEFDPESLYIFEDSLVDLGLIESIDRNLPRFLSVIQDYLEWHVERLDRPEPVVEENGAKKEGEIEGGFVSSEEEKSEAAAEEQEPTKKKRFSLIRWILNLLGIGKKKTEEEEAPEGDEEPTEPEEPEDPEERKRILTDITDLIARRMLRMDKEQALAILDPRPAVQESPFSYKNSNYLLFGAKDYPTWLSVENTRDYLYIYGFNNPDFKQARHGLNSIDDAIQMAESGDVHLCDFCGKPLMGVEYDILGDGRERCMSCSRNTVSSLEELQEIFNNLRSLFCGSFGIVIKKGITVKMVSVDELARHLGETFIPTGDFNARAVGVAIKKDENYTILIENGFPRVSIIGTIAHEMTHIWQYQNWNAEAIKAAYGDDELAVYEGMAVWAQVQYLYLINEPECAKGVFIKSWMRQDEYGRGFRSYFKRYGLTEGTFISKRTPFESGNQPL